MCGEEIDLIASEGRIAAKWRDALAHRDKWTELARLFVEHRSIEEAARRLSIAPELALYLLDFLCIELCGCRAVTCVSCLDDYRSEL